MCTLAVTTLKSVGRGGLPPSEFSSSEVLPVSGAASWREMWIDAQLALRKCVKRRKTGMEWDGTFYSYNETQSLQFG